MPIDGWMAGGAMLVSWLATEAAACSMEDATVGGVPHGKPAVADDPLLHHGHELPIVDPTILHFSHSNL